MTDYTQAIIQVLPHELAVSIDGVKLRCLDGFPLNPTLIGLRWNPGMGKTPGYIHQQGDSHGFDDFTIFEPFIKEWEKAKPFHDAAVAQAKADAARVQEAKPLDTALGALGDSDHEIIKAMEAQLHEAGKLDPALVEQRRAWRAMAKVEKQKAGH